MKNKTAVTCKIWPSPKALFKGWAFLFLLSIILTFFGALLGNAEAAVYYVSTTGLDANPGTQAQPFLTLTHGVSGLQPGDTLLVMPGIYTESINGIPGGTDWGHPVTVKAFDPQNRPILRPNSGAIRVLYFGPDSLIPVSMQHYIIVDGFVLDGANISGDTVKIDYTSASNIGAHHIRLMNSEVMHAYSSGVMVTPPEIGNNEFLNLEVHDNGSTDLNHGFYVMNNDNLIKGCHIYNNGGFGVQIYNGANGSPNRNIISNNVIYDNGQAGSTGDGVGIFTGQNNMAVQNTLWGNNGGIEVGYGAQSTLVYGNIFYNNKSTYNGFIMSGASQTMLFNNVFYGDTVLIQGPNTKFINNIVTQANWIGVYVEGATDAVVENNIIYKNDLSSPSSGSPNFYDMGSGTVSENNILTQDPLFVNPTANNFQLQTNPALSPAVGAGVNPSNYVSTDNNGYLQIQTTDSNGNAVIVPYAFPVYFYTDVNGIPRSQSGQWDIGPYSVMGDISGDGEVTMYDAALALRDLNAGGQCNTITPQQCTVSEMDGQGKGTTIDNTDVVDIAKTAMWLK